MSNIGIQVLRTIDKLDKIGRDGVVDLLQKPVSEFGADLDPVRAALIGMFLDTGSDSNGQTLENIGVFFQSVARVRSRLDLMVALEDREVEPGVTAWDRLLCLPCNDDETWRDGGRPANIAWALDDIVKAMHKAPEENKAAD